MNNQEHNAIKSNWPDERQMTLREALKLAISALDKKRFVEGASPSEGRQIAQQPHNDSKSSSC